MENNADARVEIAAPTFDVERTDATMLHLAQSLLPAFSRPLEVNRLFADHVVSAAASHVAASYGSIRLINRRPGRLAHWQETRVLDYIAANLDSDISVADLAGICRLSPGHFAHAFVATTGMPPHRFVLGKRVSRAMELLAKTDLSLGEIAVGCGFADQSHLGRVFGRFSGVTPGKWRRLQKE